MILRLLLVSILLPLAACEQEPPAEETRERMTEGETAPAAEPETLYVDVTIEGMPEVMALARYEAPGVPFTTYVPVDMKAEQVGSGEGTAVHFYANFGGVANRDAYLGFFFPTGEMRIESVEAMSDFVLEMMEQRGWRVVDMPQGTGRNCPWAEATYPFEDLRSAARASGYICVGEHGGMPFYLVTHVPAEYGDGFGPRAAQIRAHFRWRDTGAALEE